MRGEVKKGMIGQERKGEERTREVRIGEENSRKDRRGPERR